MKTSSLINVIFATFILFSVITTTLIGCSQPKSKTETDEKSNLPTAIQESSRANNEKTATEDEMAEQSNSEKSSADDDKASIESQDDHPAAAKVSEKSEKEGGEDKKSSYANGSKSKPDKSDISEAESDKATNISEELEAEPVDDAKPKSDKKSAGYIVKLTGKSDISESGDSLFFETNQGQKQVYMYGLDQKSMDALSEALKKKSCVKIRENVNPDEMAMGAVIESAKCF